MQIADLYDTKEFSGRILSRRHVESRRLDPSIRLPAVMPARAPSGRNFLRDGDDWVEVNLASLDNQSMRTYRSAKRQQEPLDAYGTVSYTRRADQEPAVLVRLTAVEEIPIRW
jgi:hypothetical protein